MIEIAIITQARMGSSRLPNKIFLDIGGRLMLDYHLERLKNAGIPIIVATTTEKSDVEIYDHALHSGFLAHRGSEKNVLARFYEAAKSHNVKHIVRVTSDCPLIDGSIIREAVHGYLSLDNEHTYLSNCIERTYPRGMDFEIFSFDDLEEAYLNAQDESDIEHVTPYINQNKSGKITLIHKKREVDNSKYRLTVDTEDDFRLIKRLIEDFRAHELSCQEIVQIMDTHNDLHATNAHVEQKKH